MTGHLCPFCGCTFPVVPDTYRPVFASFGEHGISYTFEQHYRIATTETASERTQSVLHSFGLHFFMCPQCGKESVELAGNSDKYKGIWIPVVPNAKAIPLPEYIPAPLKSDYYEACSIIALSPKASATLCRRCLQGMIRDFWHVNDRTLKLEIDALKDKIPAAQWMALDDMRKIGNIGAHMESDVNLIVEIDTEEAAVLIGMLEYLFRAWYMERESTRLLQERMHTSAERIGDAKTRHPSSSS